MQESARHLQMTRARQMRVDTRDLPEAKESGLGNLTSHWIYINDLFQTLHIWFDWCLNLLWQWQPKYMVDGYLAIMSMTRPQCHNENIEPVWVGGKCQCLVICTMGENYNPCPPFCPRNIDSSAARWSLQSVNLPWKGTIWHLITNSRLIDEQKRLRFAVRFAWQIRL